MTKYTATTTLAAFDTRMVNLCAVAVTGDDIKRFASDLSVSTQQVAAVATVESAGDGPISAISKPTINHRPK